jgi:predicted amidohydrolase
MSKRRYRAAVVQTLARLGDYDFNLSLCRRYVDEAVRQGSELVVFPECMDTGYLFDSAAHCRALAEPVPGGPFVDGLAELARTNGICIASGITERDDAAGKIFNSGVLFDREGNVALRYQKQFLATHDQNWFAFGERGNPVIDTDLGRIGLLICFDGRIPEIARSLALQGAEVILDMANFFAMDQAEMWGPARAYENGVWLVAATKAGYERSIYYPGGSMIVDPRGYVATRIPYDTHGVAVAEIDLDCAHDKRIYTANDKFADRRPELYAAMVRPYADTPVASVAQTPLTPAAATTKVAAVQMHIADGVGAGEVFDMVDHTAKLGAKVIVLPEYALLDRWTPRAAEARAAAANTQSHLVRAATIAARYGCLVAVSTVEPVGAAILHATTFLIGPGGKTIGRYRKAHLTAEEREWATPGDELPVFDTPFGRLGVMAGFDALFPETSRCLGIEAADILLWPASQRDPLERALIAVPRAADNRVAVVLANRVDCPSPGGSVVIPPTGFPHWDINVVAPRSVKMGAVMPAFIDLAVCRQKQMIPKVDMFANRLTATYGPLVGKSGAVSLAAAE